MDGWFLLAATTLSAVSIPFFAKNYNVLADKWTIKWQNRKNNQRERGLLFLSNDKWQFIPFSHRENHFLDKYLWKIFSRNPIAEMTLSNFEKIAIRWRHQKLKTLHLVHRPPTLICLGCALWIRLGLDTLEIPRSVLISAQSMHLNRDADSLTEFLQNIPDNRILQLIPWLFLSMIAYLMNK